MREPEPTWVGVILAYVCPTCHKPDRQMFTFDVPKYDDRLILSTAQGQMKPCKWCKAGLPKNLPLEVDLCPATLEQLRKAGYPVPPVN
jgi:hypothetical protein